MREITKEYGFPISSKSNSKFIQEVNNAQTHMAI
jgi:hypothetical protein